MRRDYFTCVFLACIAGALAFVCFNPLYLKYDGVVYREFGLFECIASAVYLVFFLVAVPIYSGLKKKYWISVGLACYGLLPYLPRLFYPAEYLIAGEDASLFHVFAAFILRGIYGMVNAPFAALSSLWGDDVAASLALWIFPVSVAVPFIFKAYRFYRDAYVAEQLNPASVVSAPSNSKFDRKEDTDEEKKEEPKPEVLGTVISAPAKKEPLVAPEKKEPLPDPEKKETLEAPEKKEPISAPDISGELPAGTQARPQVRQPVIDPSVLGGNDKNDGDSPFDENGVIHL
ncbi:MAG: hypothetical protein IKE53_06565 [Clostridiales bacterium]|nr:hypothetical protein [Clostridiales bacterium]